MPQEDGVSLQGGLQRTMYSDVANGTVSKRIHSTVCLGRKGISLNEN